MATGITDTQAESFTACTFAKANVPTLKTRTQMYQRPGFDGYGGHVLGDGHASFIVVAVKLDTKENIATWRGKIDALQSRFISVEDDRGEMHEGILVFETGVPRVTRSDTTPGTVGYRAEYRLRCVVAIG